MWYSARDIEANSTDRVSVLMKSTYIFQMMINSRAKNEQSKGEGEPEVEVKYISGIWSE